MQPISFMTKEDVKAAVLEALSEHEPQKQTPKEDKTIYGLQGLADFLGVGITTAWSLKKSGKIPYHQAGKKIFFLESQVLAATSKR